MSNLVTEIQSVGIQCYGLYEGVPYCGELTPGDQAIVDACVACNGKNFSTAEKTALFALLDAGQQTAYTEARNNEIKLLWVQHLDEIGHKSFWLLYNYKEGSKQDMLDDFADNIEAVLPLWSDT